MSTFRSVSLSLASLACRAMVVCLLRALRSAWSLERISSDR